MLKKLLLAMSFLTLIGATTNQARAKPKKIIKKVSREQHGLASWYGKKLNWRKTASGEKLNPNDFTVAHKFLPFNSIIKITNKMNGKSVLARVNDRGPFAKNRIVDLSEKTAKAIDMEGTTQVVIEPVDEPLEIAEFYQRTKK